MKERQTKCREVLTKGSTEKFVRREKRLKETKSKSQRQLWLEETGRVVK